MQTSHEAESWVGVAIVPDASDLVAEVPRTTAEVFVCGLDSPSRDALESLRALQRDEPRPVAMFVDRSDPAGLIGDEAGVPYDRVALSRYLARDASAADLRRPLALATGVWRPEIAGLLAQERWAVMAEGCDPDAHCPSVK